MQRSVVEYFGKEESGHKCGYCKSLDSSLAHGMWTHYLTCQDYQDLLDRGWRRSGKYCYKPIMNLTCCPQYTIRLEVTNAKLRKSQKKVIKTVNKFLTTGVKPLNGRSISDCDGEEETEVNGNVCIKDLQPHPPTPKMDISFNCGVIKGADPDKPKCRKAKEIRREKKLEKMERQNTEAERLLPKKVKNKEKTYEDWIEDVPTDSKLKLEVKLVRCCPEDPEFTESFNKELEVYRNYQMKIHKDEGDEVNERQFRRFLCDGPLIPVFYDDDLEGTAPKCGFGAFHQQYYIDGRLVAVGVLDILPNCVSSKYFFYDPNYQFLSLGTYSALREIYFIRSLNQQCASIKYYYMGYYIHSCPKMKYKGKFIPSYLLCPETYLWQPIENCVEKLDTHNYSRLEENRRTEPERFDKRDTLVLYHRAAMPFEVFLTQLRSSSNRNDQNDEVEEYTTLTGKASRSLLLFRN